MDSMASVCIRDANADDVDAIAALHADSWRRHYRGAYSDEFLDGDVLADRIAVWTARMASPTDGCTLVAQVGEEDTGTVVGFAHTVFGADPVWGALVDNLHVRYVAKRQGLGSLLMVRTAQRLIAHDGTSGLYLWVLEQNRDAQAFYLSLGGSLVGRRAAIGPGGVPGRLTGQPMALRCAWQDPSRLITVGRAAQRES